jgi:hypothetical protein
VSLERNPRYLALHAAREAVLSSASKRIPAAAMASQARAMRLWNGREAWVRTDAQFAVLLDLAVFAPVGGHTPALERELRAREAEPGSAEADVVAALHAVALTLFVVEDAAADGGAVARDMLGGERFVLWDRFLEKPELRGCAFAGRLMRFDGFAMATGTTCPITDEVLEIMQGFPVPDLPMPAMLPALTPPAPAVLDFLRTEAGKPDFMPRLYRAALDLSLFGVRPDRQ